METVLVTGGAGYVGTVLVPYLLEKGYYVRVLDRFRHNSPGLMAHVDNPNFQAIRGDVLDEDCLRQALYGMDYVIPLAAVVGAPACEIDKGYSWSLNYHSIVVLSRLLQDHQRVIYPNTNSGYGTTKPGEVCDEETPLKPISTYGKTKCEAERWLMGSMGNRENTVSLRFATAFGPSPRMRLDLLVNDFVYRAVRDKSLVLFEPHFRRNYIHVKDMARSFVHVMKNWDSMKGQVYNVGLPVSYNKECLCRLIQEYVPGFIVYFGNVGSDLDKRDYDVSNHKIYKTGFECEIELRTGILELIKAYKMLPGPEFTNLR